MTYHVYIDKIYDKRWMRDNIGTIQKRHYKFKAIG